MNANEMIQRLRGKFNEQGIALALDLRTNHRTMKLEELTYQELCDFYFVYFPKPKSVSEIAHELAIEKELKRLRSIILKEATAIGLLEPDNWTKFNAFMIKWSPLKKSLNQYSITEFGELIKQFKSLRTKYERDAKIPQTKAWYHKHKIAPPSQN